MEKTFGWSTTQFDMIDWQAHHGALQKLKFQEKKCITKFIHQSLPMGDVYHKIDPSPQSSKCSSCNIHTETTQHLYRCSTRHVVMEDIFLETESSCLEENHTCPQLAHSLLEALYCEIDKARYPHFTHRHGANDPKFQKLHQLQAFVGWSQLFQGRLVMEWSQLQEEFLEENAAKLEVDQRHYTGSIWAKKVVTL
jgi:hypothetical protein